MSRARTIILVRPSHIVSPGHIFVPFGIWYVGTALAARGFRVVLLDQEGEADFYGRLDKELKRDPLCVGISSMSGRQLGNALTLARSIRRDRPHLPLILGGVHASLLPREVLSDTPFDIAIHGEAEESMVSIAEALTQNRSLGGIPGVAFRTEGKAVFTGPGSPLPVGRIPPLAWDLLPLEPYILAIRPYDMRRSFPIHLSRGCAGGCTFCYNFYLGKRPRYLPLDTIRDMVTVLVDRYGVDGFICWDDNLFADKAYVRAFSGMLLQQKKQLRWSAAGRVQDLLALSKDDWSLVRESGCISLSFGIESGAPQMRRLLGKELSREQIGRWYRSLRQQRFPRTELYFMTGLPGESTHDFFQTLQELLRWVLLPGARPWIFCYHPVPGTALAEKAQQYGWISPASSDEWSLLNLAVPYLPVRMNGYLRLLALLRSLLIQLESSEIRKRIGILLRIVCLTHSVRVVAAVNVPAAWYRRFLQVRGGIAGKVRWLIAGVLTRVERSINRRPGLMRSAHDTAVWPVPFVRRTRCAHFIREGERFPRRLQVEVSTVCAAKCPACWRQQAPLREQKIMSHAFYERLLTKDVCARSGGVMLSWIGEPLEDPLIVEKVRLAKWRGMREVSFATHGALLSAELASGLISAGLDRLIVSIDGASKETFERARAGLSYERVVGNIRTLLALKKKMKQPLPLLHVNFLRTKENAGEWEQVRRLWSGVADRVMSWPLSPGTSELFAPDERHLRKRMFRRRGICPYLWEQMVVDVNGLVRLCCALDRPDLVMGDANTTSLADIWQGEQFRRYRQAHLAGDFSVLPGCDHCHLWRYTEDGVTHSWFL